MPIQGRYILIQLTIPIQNGNLDLFRHKNVYVNVGVIRMAAGGHKTVFSFHCGIHFLYL